MGVLTIGHSNRSIDDFLALLAAHGVALLVDIRSFPGSRRHPQFGREALETSLAVAGVAYRHMKGLGGRRQVRPGSRNAAWQHEAFRGYADHMETPEFRDALDDLVAVARESVTAIMCAEALWWQCHRRLTSDALVARGVEVRHIMGPGKAVPHEITAFARIENGEVSYPGLLGS